MFLIVNADDYGYSDARDDGILECYRGGAVSSVSLMVGGHSAPRAVEKAHAAGLHMGLHLNLTEGSPVSQVPHNTLVDGEGFFLGKYGLREAVRDNRVDPIEVELEIQSQIDRFTELTGNRPYNVDGHQHIHVVPGICEVFAKVLERNQIRVSRLPVERGLADHDWESEQRLTFMLEVVEQSRQAALTFKQHHIGAPGFIGLRCMGKDMTIPQLQSCILQAHRDQTAEIQSSSQHKNLSGKQHMTENSETGGKIPGGHVCELMVHPGKVTGSEGGVGCGPDEFSQSQYREHEMKILMSREMMDFYKDNGIKLVAFKSLR